MIDIGIIVASQVQSTFYETYLKSTKRFRISFSVDTLSSLTTAIIVYGEPEVLIIHSIQDIGSIEEFSVILKIKTNFKDPAHSGETGRSGPGLCYTTRDPGLCFEIRQPPGVHRCHRKTGF